VSARISCPCCERPLSAALLRDVSGIPEQYRGPCEQACDQCCARWHVLRFLRFAEQARFRGMPAAVVTKLAKKHGDKAPPARAALTVAITARLAGRLLPGADRVVRRQANERRASEIRDRIRQERATRRDRTTPPPDRSHDDREPHR
jgi:hypothetical protein